MIEVKLLDNEWLENIINSLLIEEITDIEKDVYEDKDYKEFVKKIKAIEDRAAGSPTADVLYEYRENIEYKDGYEYTAAYLNGLKAGFNLAFFLKPDLGQLQAKGKQIETVG